MTSRVSEPTDARWRCACILCATGIAGGEVVEDRLDDFVCFDARDDAEVVPLHMMNGKTEP